MTSHTYSFVYTDNGRRAAQDMNPVRDDIAYNYAEMLASEKGRSVTLKCRIYGTPKESAQVVKIFGSEGRMAMPEIKKTNDIPITDPHLVGLMDSPYVHYHYNDKGTLILTSSNDESNATPSDVLLKEVTHYPRQKVVVMYGFEVGQYKPKQSVKRVLASRVENGSFNKKSRRRF